MLIMAYYGKYSLHSNLLGIYKELAATVYLGYIESNHIILFFISIGLFVMLIFKRFAIFVNDLRVYLYLQRS